MNNKMDNFFDVVVAGGGPAGIAAAVSAARSGVRVALIERFGILGGMMTSGHVHPILGHTAPYTMYHEVCDLLSQGHPTVEHAVTRNGSEVSVDPEEAKYRLLRLVYDSGVQIFLQTAVVDVVMDASSVIGLIISSQQGPVRIGGKIFVDATGDGFVAYRAGAPYQKGREKDGHCQPASLEFTLEHVDEERGITCWGGSDPVTLPDGRRYGELCREAHDSGLLPRNVSIVRLHRTFYPGERNVNATQVNGLDLLSADGVLQAELTLREQIIQVTKFLQQYVPGFEHCTVKSSGSTLGVRETRRIMGRYLLSDQDVEQGARFEDAVVHKAWFLIDIHNPTGGGQAEGRSQPAIPYDIPLRCLIPLEVQGLLTAGRCISGTHRAHASYRVMGIALAVGQAAGVAAALCAQKNIMPGQLDVGDVQAVLTDRGAVLRD